MTTETPENYVKQFMPIDGSLPSIKTFTVKIAVALDIFAAFAAFAVILWQGAEVFLLIFAVFLRSLSDFFSGKTTLSGGGSARYDRRFRRERVLCSVDAKIPFGANLRGAAQAALIISGWAAAQFPYLIEPDVTIYSAASAPPITLQLLLGALAAGALLLFPSYFYLFRVFKSKTAFTALSEKPDEING